MGDDKFFQNTGWPKTVGMLIAAAIVVVLAKRWSAQPGRTLTDPATGEQVVLKRSDTLMFVPMLYWGYLLVVIAGLLFFDRA